MIRILLMATLVLLMVLSGCLDNSRPVVNSFKTGVLRWGNTFRYQDFTPADYDSLAMYDYVCTSETSWLSNRAKVAAAELRSRNPDIKLGVYFRALALPEWVRLQAEEGKEFATNWNNLVKPWLAQTNKLDPATGKLDTATTYKCDYSINLLKPEGRANNIIAQLTPETLEIVDWVFVDFLSSPIPNLKKNQPPAYREIEHGDADYDGDFIGHWDDPDEQEALKYAMQRYMIEMRQHVGPDIEIIANGHLAVRSYELFFPLVDGVYLEGFPRWTYCGNDLCFAAALDESDPPSLWDILPYYDTIMLEDRWRMMKYGHLGGLWDNTVEVQKYKRSSDPPRAVSFSLSPVLGQPEGEAFTKDNMIMRKFSGGLLWVEYGEETLDVGVENSDVSKPIHP